MTFEASGNDLHSSSIRRILIVRVGAMGDVIHTLPAVRALRAAFPHAHIGWLIEERWAELLCAKSVTRRGPRSALRPLVDEIHTVNLKAWGKSLLTGATVQQIATTWNDVRGAAYDIAIDLQGAIRSALLARWSGARRVYGAADPRESPASLWYTHPVITRGKHVVEQNLSVSAVLIGDREKLSPPDISGDFPCDPLAESSISRRLAELEIAKFAILSPGAGWGAKRWPAEKYGEVARELAQSDIAAVVNYGPGEEHLARTVREASGGAACAMACTISELIALTRRAQLFIGGDTGPTHLAAALGVPVVAIFGPTDPVRNGPYGSRSIVLRSGGSVTSHKRREEPDQGLLSIETGTVVTAARQLLSPNAEGPRAS
ncbi:MAG TPA: lipopolysaccharide heptosyltransferase I [Candidatus Binatia bacterium]|nr:lipopolysaccharide heptosyltransferase I [Candidatus Binatia bacterium]